MGSTTKKRSQQHRAKLRLNRRQGSKHKEEKERQQLARRIQMEPRHLNQKREERVTWVKLWEEQVREVCLQRKRSKVKPVHRVHLGRWDRQSNL